MVSCSASGTIGAFRALSTLVMLKSYRYTGSLHAIDSSNKWVRSPLSFESLVLQHEKLIYYSPTDSYLPSTLNIMSSPAK